MAEEVKKGGISVESEHIFPIIKKWLYSEKEIFLRELVSNACDAVTKLRRLSSLGEYDGEDNYRIDVRFSAREKTITVEDNGIGMTEEELERYICHVALSGALEFIQKYEGKDKDANGIIGHFGLGFYSAFMVADRVEVLTRSYTGAPAVHWTCEESGAYETEPGERTRGTSVILHVNEDGEEYLKEYRLREVLERYCAFMPVEIYLTDTDAEEDAAAAKAEKAESADQKSDGADEKADAESTSEKADTENAGEKTDVAEAEPKEKKPVNDTHPLWLRQPSECTDEEYKAFYHKVFGDYRDPLFYLHISADYPLNFKGILFFPRLRENYENLEGKIKLYYNQVFVADNIKEVIPEYLLMLRGVLDCPELPLNVSRSYLQNSGYVKKIAAHIVKKVADKLNGMFNTDRPAYEKLWRDIRTFTEYAAISDRKFCDRVKSSLLLPLADGSYVTVDEYLERVKDKNEKTVYYATDVKLQAQYIALYEAKGIPVAVMDSVLDTRFAETVEQVWEGVRFLRVDSGTSALSEEGETEQDEGLTALFTPFSTDRMKLTVRSETLTDPSVPAVLTVDEESRRMEDMMRMYAPSEEMPCSATLVLNRKNDIINRLADGSYGDNAAAVAEQVYRLSLLSQRKLSADEMKQFLSGSYELLRRLS